MSMESMVEEVWCLPVGRTIRHALYNVFPDRHAAEVLRLVKALDA